MSPTETKLPDSASTTSVDSRSTEVAQAVSTEPVTLVRTATPNSSEPPYTPTSSPTPCVRPDTIDPNKMYDVRWGGKDHPRDTITGVELVKYPSRAWNSANCYFDMNEPRPTPTVAEATPTRVVVADNTPKTTPNSVVTKVALPPATATPTAVEVKPTIAPAGRSGYVLAGDGSDPNKKIALFTGLGFFQPLSKLIQQLYGVVYNPNIQVKATRTYAEPHQGFITFRTPGGGTINHQTNGQTICLEVPSEDAFYTLGRNSWIQRSLTYCIGQVFAVSNFSTDPPTVIEELTGQ